jgi:phosphoglycolate phosphatase
MHASAYFDLDGTLIDSRADLAKAVNLTRADYGLPPLPVDVVAGYVGEGIRPLLARSLPGWPGPLEEAVDIARRHYFEHLLDETALYPGVVDALQRLHDAGWKLAVVTNKPIHFVEPILHGLGLRAFFAALVGGDDGVALKPDPAPIRLAAERMGLTGLAGGWMIGDHHTDLEAGRRAGLRRCYCRVGFGDPQGESYEMAVDSLDEFARNVLI